MEENTQINSTCKIIMTFLLALFGFYLLFNPFRSHRCTKRPKQRVPLLFYLNIHRSRSSRVSENQTIAADNIIASIRPSICNF